MSLYNPVVWQDGMFMKAQHFQQLERYHSNHSNLLASYSMPLYWGIKHIEINTGLLSLGKIGITVAEGILQDKTPFSLPTYSDAPMVRDVDSSVIDTVMYLCCPLPSERAELFGKTAESARYSVQEQEAVDSVYESEDTTSIKVGRLNFKLLFEHEDRSSYTAIPILKISEVKPDGSVILDTTFIPTCLDIKGSVVLTKFVTEFASILKHRAESIVERLGMVDQQGVSSVADFMLLQTINKIEPLFWHLANIEGMHPESLYRILVQAEGELATLCSAGRRPSENLPYDHANLTHCLTPLLKTIKETMSVMSEQRAVPLILKAQNYGIHTAAIPDCNLIKNTTLILAVKADVTVDVLLTRFVAQTKIGSINNIRNLINLQLSGIGLTAMPVVPRQLPYHAGYTYFELDKSSDEWLSLIDATGIAVHVSGDFKNLSLQLWAVRL